MERFPVEKWDEWNRLYDLYGSLLTEKQRNVFEMYYQEDLSLGEIAELTGISRQGVHEHLRRAEEGLLAFERQLSLMRRQTERRRLLQEAMEHCSKADWDALQAVLRQLWEMEDA